LDLGLLHKFSNTLSVDKLHAVSIGFKTQFSTEARIIIKSQINNDANLKILFI